MLLANDEVYKISDDTGTLMLQLDRVERDNDYIGYSFNILSEDGLERLLFQPFEKIETDEMLLLKGQEMALNKPCKMILFKENLLQAEVGNLLFT